MKLLEKSEYTKVTEVIKNVSINTLFAEAVIEQKINGKIFVDNTETPPVSPKLHRTS